MNFSLVNTVISRQLSKLFQYPIFKKNVSSPLSNPIKYIQQSSVRNCHSKFEGFFNASEKSVGKLKLKDNVPDDYILIYKAPVESYIRLAYPVMLGLALAAPSLVLYKYYVNGELILRREAKTKIFLNPEVEIWVYGAALVLSAAASFAIVFKIPFRIYKHSVIDDYRAVFLSVVPLKLSENCATCHGVDCSLNV